jgi:hypothetical protein
MAAISLCFYLCVVLAEDGRLTVGDGSEGATVELCRRVLRDLCDCFSRGVLHLWAKLFVFAFGKRPDGDGRR